MIMHLFHKYIIFTLIKDLTQTNTRHANDSQKELRTSHHINESEWSEAIRIKMGPSTQNRDPRSEDIS